MSKEFLIPPIATEKVAISGSEPIEQSLPDDIIIAAALYDAWNTKDGEPVFLIEAFLKILVASSPEEEKSILIENLSLITSPISIYQIENIENIIEKIRDVKRIEDLMELIKDIEKQLGKNKKQNITIPGLLAGKFLKEIGQYISISRPQKLKEYYTVFPDFGGINVHETARLVRESYDKSMKALKAYRLALEALDIKPKELLEPERKRISRDIERLRVRIEQLQKRINELNYNLNKGLKMREEMLRARLEQKIEAFDFSKLEIKRMKMELEDEIESLRKEYEDELEKKNRAIAKDKERLEKLEKIQKDLDKFSKKELDKIKKKIENVISEISHYIDKLEDEVMVNAGSLSNGKDTYVLIPFLIFGLQKGSKKKIKLIGPSQLVKEKSKDHTLLEPRNESLQHLQNMIEERIEIDTSLRSFIYDEADLRNAFALEEPRKFILRGLIKLVSDGFVKRNDIKRIVSKIESFELIESPEIIEITDTTDLGEAISPEVTIEDGGKGYGSVRIFVTDSEGKRIPEAVLTLNRKEYTADKRGIINLSLKSGKKRGIIKAEGFYDKKIVFPVKNDASISLQVKLDPIPPEEMLAKRIDEITKKAERTEKLWEKLQKAFEKHGDAILRNPKYLSVLEEMLSEMGISPEAWIAEASKTPDMVSRLFKKGPYYEGLRRDIISLIDTSKESGGILALSEVIMILSKKGWKISPDEIIKTIEDLSKQGLIGGISVLDNGIKVVHFVPVEMTKDPQTVMSVAAKHKGKITLETVILELGWTEERAERALESLVNAGIAKVQKTYSRSYIYWFPSLMEKK